MFQRYSLALRRRIQLASGLVFGAIFLVWTVSLWMPFVADWLFKHNVFGLTIIGLMAQIIILLDEILRGPGIQTAVGSDQNADLDRLREYVREHRPVKADLIEYSSFMVNSLLEDLRRQQTEVRLLLCDPSAACNEWQKHRIEACIATLADVTFKSYSKVEVRCYQVPASVRGRKIDDQLNIGWYFYGHDLYGVQGTNTMIMLRTESHDGKLFEFLFDQTFDLMWNHPQTRELDLSNPFGGQT